MSLAVRVSTLATRVSTECKALWAEVNGKAPTVHAHSEYVRQIQPGSVNLRRVRGLVEWEQSGSNIPGDLVIETNQLFTNVMTNLHITGYDYIAPTTIDLNVSYYTYPGPTFYHGEAHNNGLFAVSQVRLMRRISDGTVVIVITSGEAGNFWQYPKISVDGIFGHTLIGDAELQGWSASIRTDLSAYAPIVGVPVYHSFHTGHLPDWTEVAGKPATFTPTAHGHAIADLPTDATAPAALGTAAAGSAASVARRDHVHPMPTAANVGAAPTVHGHALTDANITGLLPAAQLPATAFHTGHLPDWTEVAGKPATFTPATHNHDSQYYTETEIDADRVYRNVYRYAYTSLPGARPAVPTGVYIEWVGSQDPAALTIPGDTWIQTA